MIKALLSRVRLHALAAAIVAAACFSGPIAWQIALPTDADAATLLRISRNEQVARLKVVMGQSETYRLTVPFGEIVVGDPETADVNALSDRTLYVLGRKLGTTNNQMELLGAIVALDPTSGDILAMASRPGFDPNVLSRELTAKQWVEIVQDEGRPLNNRATQGQYPPGSTFKVPMAVAALESNTMSPSSSVLCTGGYQFGKRVYHDWKATGHGYVDLHKALVHSCDVYFYTVGQRMGIDTMAEYAKEFGLGRETGVELPSERMGIVPSTAWKQKAKNEPWLPGETISAAIGQGYVTVTPLQMASMIGTVANNGVSFRPRLVQAIMDRTTGNLQELPAVARGKAHAKPETFRLVKEALADVVTEGTATRAKSSIVTIGGKTGTAQTASLGKEKRAEKDIPKKLRDHAWFVAFAPVDHPKIAVAVLAEHMGHGGSAAAPLAKEVIETYMKLMPQVPTVASPS